jgi:hypothetical protein
MMKWIEGPVALRGRLGRLNYILVTSKVDAHPGTAALGGWKPEARNAQPLACIGIFELHSGPDTGDSRSA